MVRDYKSLIELRRAIKDMRDKKQTWEKIGKNYKVNKAIPWRIFYKDYEPKDPEIRYKLGLDGSPVEVVIRVARRDPKTGTFLPNP